MSNRQLGQGDIMIPNNQIKDEVNLSLLKMISTNNQLHSTNGIFIQQRMQVEYISNKMRTKCLPEIPGKRNGYLIIPGAFQILIDIRIFQYIPETVGVFNA